MSHTDLVVGDVFVHTPGRTITAAEDALFCGLTMNTQAIHLDEHWAASTEHGQRLVNAFWTLATLVGMSGPQITQGTLVATLGVDDVRFPAPLFHGDTLHGSTEIVSVRSSESRPGMAIVVLRHVGRNQDGTIVAEASRTVLMR